MNVYVKVLPPESVPLGICSLPSIINQWLLVAWAIPLEHSTQVISGSEYVTTPMKNSVLYSVTHSHSCHWVANKCKHDNSFLP